MVKRTIRPICCLGLLVLLIGVSGCVPARRVREFHVRIDPSSGHVPYEARIACTPLVGTYTYELPDGSVITSTRNELAVVVDSLNWRATVSWTDGRDVCMGTATAYGTNAVPRILRPRIGGNPQLWYLEPRERTLIDFTHHEATLSGAESGVDYDGEWRVVEIRLECPLKTVCQDVVEDSVFCPPYQADTYHALVNGWLLENACIVYPTFTGETAPNGLPYAPAAEHGYTYDAYRVRNLYHAVTFSAQTGRIHVTVEDNWGRLTSASFDIPVGALVWSPEYGPPDDHTEAILYVAGEGSPLYHLSTCPEVCLIDVDDRVYFGEERNALESGRSPCPRCR